MDFLEYARSGNYRMVAVIEPTLFWNPAEQCSELRLPMRIGLGENRLGRLLHGTPAESQPLGNFVRRFTRREKLGDSGFGNAETEKAA